MLEEGARKRASPVWPNPTVYIDNLLCKFWLREIKDQGGGVGLGPKIIVVYRTSVSLVVEPATHLVVTTRSTPRSVTAAAHSDDENRTLYDGSTGGVASGV